MTVPPNYSVPPEHPPPPGGYGYGAGYGGPARPEPPGRRNWLISGIVIGCTAALLASILLLTFLANQGVAPTDDPTLAGGETPTEDTTTPSEDPTTPMADEVIGKCMPYEPQVADSEADLSTDCGAPEAFWVVTAWSDEPGATVDDEGGLTDNGPAYDLCGAEYGTFEPGRLWTDWYYIYDQDTGEVDYLYCIEAIGNPDEYGRTPYMPDTGVCFDDSSEWWTVPCDADEALYKVVDTVEFDEPRELDDDEAADAATCGGEFFWEVTNLEGATTAILCGDEL